MATRQLCDNLEARFPRLCRAVGTCLRAICEICGPRIIMAPSPCCPCVISFVLSPGILLVSPILWLFYREHPMTTHLLSLMSTSYWNDATVTEEQQWALASMTFGLYAGIVCLVFYLCVNRQQQPTTSLSVIDEGEDYYTLSIIDIDKYS